MIYVCVYIYIYIYIYGCINSRRLVAVATKFCTLAPNIYGSSIWNHLHVTILVSRIFMCFRFFFKLLHHCTERPLRWTNTLPQTTTIISTLLYTQNPKEKTLILQHSKEYLCPALFSNLKRKDAAVLSGIRTVSLLQFVESLPVCYAGRMNTNVKLMVNLQGVRTWIMLL